MENKNIIIVFGPPGSGKGTQSEFIEQKFGIPSISTGSILRDFCKNDTEDARIVNDLISKGDLVSDEFMETVLFSELNHSKYKNGFILDGYPRNKHQAKIFETILKKINQNIFKVFVFETNKEESYKRISSRYVCSNCKATYSKIYKQTKKEGVCDFCGSTDFAQRSDDLSKEVVYKRFEIYDRFKNEIVDYYKSKDLIYFVNAERNISDISIDIERVIYNNIKYKD